MKAITQGPNSSLPWHRHSDSRIVLILNGKVKEREADGVFKYHAGEFILRPPFHLHANDPSEVGADYVRLPLSKDCWKQLTIKNHWNSARGRFNLQTVDLDRLKNLQFVGNSFLDKLSFDTDVSRIATGEANNIDSLADDMAAVEGPPIRLDQKAEEMGLQKYELTRKFRKRFGMTPIAFRMEARLSKALQLLEGTDWSLSLIAAECGFSDQSHFSRSIVSATKMTPASLRLYLQ